MSALFAPAVAAALALVLGAGLWLWGRHGAAIWLEAGLSFCL
jgi:hypothetical protein